MKLPNSLRERQLLLLGYPYADRPDTGRGIDRYLSTLAEAYRKRGLPFELVSNGPFANHLEQLLLGEPEIYRQVAVKKKGFWHAVSPVGGRVAGVLGRSPLVTTIHDVVPFFRMRRHPLRYRYLKWCIQVACRFSTRVIATFEFNKNFLVSRMGVPKNKVSVVPIGVDPKTLVSPGGLEPHGQSRQNTVLFLGSWNPFDRGGDLLVRALPGLLREVPSASLLFSARGPEVEAIHRLAVRLSVDRSLQFIGFVPENRLGKVLGSAEVFAYPSRIGFSLSVMQAMQIGVPTVVTDCLDMSEYVGSSGIVCPPEQPEALGQALASVMLDKSLAAKLSAAGRSRVAEFSIDRMIDGTLETYRDAGLAS